MPTDIQTLFYDFIQDLPTETGIRFCAETNGMELIFSGELQKKLFFREALHTLYRVTKNTPKQVSLRNWNKTEDGYIQLCEYLESRSSDKNKKSELDQLRKELEELRETKNKEKAALRNAIEKYLDHIYRKDCMLFSPSWLMTVHPDLLLLEATNEKDNLYANLYLQKDLFSTFTAPSYGTYLIQHPDGEKIDRIREYKTTTLTINRSETGSEIPFPALQRDRLRQAATGLSLRAMVFDLHPTDIYNLCSRIKRGKRKANKTLHFFLDPGHPIRILPEPQGEELICQQSIYSGEEPQVAVVSSCRNLLLLESLIAISKQFTMYLPVSSTQWFIAAQMENMIFTLGSHIKVSKTLPEEEHSSTTKAVPQITYLLKGNWQKTSSELKEILELEDSSFEEMMTAYIKMGKVIYDPVSDTYRTRRLPAVKTEG